jgi:hypothetical protein
VGRATGCRNVQGVSSYSERLTVPWWAWPAGFAAASFCAAELAMGFLPLRVPLTFIVACALAAAGLIGLSRIRVSVRDGEFLVDDARLPVEFISTVEVIDAEARRDLLGVDAEPLAFVILRSWVRGGVRIDLDDPDDPTPYWFVSSRRPVELAEALRQARNAKIVTPAPGVPA